ncbi:MAG TPA: hypothetical protein VFV73_04930 [Streptosporangiaceae bacterium]|nr:hypothetical protein [Streptosporangiaceae bacterium]
MLTAYLLFILPEYAVWIAMIVFAYNRGGTAVAGFVAVAQLVPAAIVAPVAASIADRWSPAALLAGGYLAQTAGMAGTAVAIVAGALLVSGLAHLGGSRVVEHFARAPVPALPADPSLASARTGTPGWPPSAGPNRAGCCG